MATSAVPAPGTRRCHPPMETALGRGRGGTHQAAAEVHQARFRRSATVGCGQRGSSEPAGPCAGDTPWVPELPDRLAATVPADAHHEDAAGRSARVALGFRGADGLEVVGLLAGVEGVVVEGGHQVGVHLAEELAHLGWGHRVCTQTPPHPVSAPAGTQAGLCHAIHDSSSQVSALRWHPTPRRAATWATLTWYQWSSWLESTRKPPSSMRTQMRSWGRTAASPTPWPCPGQGRTGKEGGQMGSQAGGGPARRPQVWGPLRSTSVPGAPVLGTGSRNNRPPWGV